MNLLSGIIGNRLSYDSNTPAWALPSGGSLSADFPQTAMINVYPHRMHPQGPVMVFTNGHYVSVPPKSYVTEKAPAFREVLANCGMLPDSLGHMNLSSMYSINEDGDYTLTVQPAVYKMYNHTNWDILDRVLLPEVTTKVHLLRNVEERHPFPRR
jgi:hypothetical protein